MTNRRLGPWLAISPTILVTDASEWTLEMKRGLLPVVGRPIKDVAWVAYHNSENELLYWKAFWVFEHEQYTFKVYND